MVIYFSGTGNSRHIAGLLKDGLGDEVVDSSVYIRKKEGASLTSKKPFIFVFPAYASYMPRVLEKFIYDSKFDGCERFYFVVTCGAGASMYGMGRKLQKLCARIGKEFCGIERVVMPENYICLFFAPSPETAGDIVYKAEKKLPSIVDKIMKEEKLHKPALVSVATDVVNPVFYKLLVTDRYFKADKDKCVSCGKCVEVCPLANVTLENGRPVWHGDCTQCQACINRCPTQAIDFGFMTKGKRRYFLP